ncbi:hypothetical protein [Clostridium brassicae]|uniref:Holin n=1 Tax=Clostridium brassicae TaxID=2999072 RepID=A0ABT4D6I2_9CLOT|nr:hypothetical protein [Clostridium brassicae]MCY6957911.1 hypothetical protein [Clostridium brassicae]
MPYELLANGGAVAAGFVILGFLIKNYTDSNKNLIETINSNNRSTETKYEKLVDETMQQCKRREDVLIEQLDKYNSSLKEISENIKVIPHMQEDINFLKEKIGE